MHDHLNVQQDFKDASGSKKIGILKMANVVYARFM